jgi:hypothetical protein
MRLRAGGGDNFSGFMGGGFFHSLLMPAKPPTCNRAQCGYMRSMSQPNTPNAPANEPIAEHATKVTEAAVNETDQGSGEETPARARLDPTRYGDWELNGKCVDF